jgi:hypothetical protein
VNWYLASELEAEDATMTMDDTGQLMTMQGRTIHQQEMLWVKLKQFNRD